MSKAVLISIRPKWVEKIANGEKTIEVRKTRPKLDTPFKCYIYCTRDKHLAFMQNQTGTNLIACMDVDAAIPVGGAIGNGKVIGELTCDRIYELAPLNHAPDDVEQQSCLTREEIVNYLKGTGYGWHISDLVIYDTPHDLGEFERPHECNECDEKWASECNTCYEKNKIKRPPQSWCYVEAMKNG
jgi:predicted transcriptional regulator